MVKRFGLTCLVLLMAGQSIADREGRWYNDKQVENGGLLFSENCTSCHGQNGEGTLDWKRRDANGNLPPPPINGTAHAWHHDIDVLRETIKLGGSQWGGQMPAFNGRLSSDEINDVIAYFQSKWPDDVFRAWSQRNQKSGLPSISN
jgi:mono/diheme cytochrome c family protein